MAAPKWICGITTVPQRVDSLLPATMQSLAGSGFIDPYLFIDGAADITGIEGFRGVTVRHPGVGQLGNWISGIIGLYVADPAADRYAMFEDDLVCCQDLRAYLDSCPYPDKGYWNLLTHDQNLVMTGGIVGWHASNQRGRGAVGLVFDRLAVQTLIRSEFFTGYLASGHRDRGDGMVLEALHGAGYKEYVHYPSLLQHVGEESILGHKYGRVLSFYGEGWSPMLTNGKLPAQDIA